MKPIFRVFLLFLTPLIFSSLDTSTATAWEPTKPIEFVMSAGTGGGADQMARLIAGIAEKHKLSPRPLVPVNKSGGAGAEGFLEVKGKKGDPHVIIITLSNLFTTPLATGVPFSWKDLTPVARIALDVDERVVAVVSAEVDRPAVAPDELEAEDPLRVLGGGRRVARPEADVAQVFEVDHGGTSAPILNYPGLAILSAACSRSTKRTTRSAWPPW